MLSRRMFTGCAICAAMGFTADVAFAQTPPGLKRTIVARSDGPIDGYEVLETILDVEPDVVIGWHIHPGTETGYVLEGGGELQVKGEATRMTKPGMSYAIASETPHTLKNGQQATKLILTYTVQKGKPLLIPVSAPL